MNKPAFQTNTKLTSSEIGKAIGRSRQAVDSYIADLRATTLLELDLKIFHLNLLGILQDRIAKRLGIPQRTLSDHLAQVRQNKLQTPVGRESVTIYGHYSFRIV
ncbi:HTH domain-containing protein [Desulfobacula sp.]|uniref:HTH domain-containing protein n=1 Tax=Desulfobacula sp. TaxID=2593537 RepID=UPI00260F2036|nr:HTH domain-containing protein [Desulfobacula sp.]